MGIGVLALLSILAGGAVAGGSLLRDWMRLPLEHKELDLRKDQMEQVMALMRGQAEDKSSAAKRAMEFMQKESRADRDERTMARLLGGIGGGDSLMAPPPTTQAPQIRRSGVPSLSGGLGL